MFASPTDYVREPLQVIVAGQRKPRGAARGGGADFGHRLEPSDESRETNSGRACGGARRASGSVTRARRSNSTSALRQLTSFGRPSAPNQSSHSHTRRDRALRVSPGSLTAARTRSTIAPVNVRPNSCMGRTIRPIGNSVQCVH